MVPRGLLSLNTHARFLSPSQKRQQQEPHPPDMQRQQQPRFLVLSGMRAVFVQRRPKIHLLRYPAMSPMSHLHACPGSAPAPTASSKYNATDWSSARAEASPSDSPSSDWYLSRLPAVGEKTHKPTNLKERIKIYFCITAVFWGGKTRVSVCTTVTSPLEQLFTGWTYTPPTFEIVENTLNQETLLSARKYTKPRNPTQRQERRDCPRDDMAHGMACDGTVRKWLQYCCAERKVFTCRSSSAGADGGDKSRGFCLSNGRPGMDHPSRKLMACETGDVRRKQTIPL